MSQPPNVADIPGYSAAHVRVRVERGPASAFPCIGRGCARAAEQWAVIHERAELISASGLIYSADIHAYQPMCPSCHRLYDLARDA